MDLPRDGQEYAHITFADLPADAAIEISVDRRTTWHPSETTGADERRILLRGPDCPRTEGLPVLQNTTVWIRLTDSPEDVIRTAGTIQLC